MSDSGSSHGGAIAIVAALITTAGVIAAAIISTGGGGGGGAATPRGGGNGGNAVPSFVIPAIDTSQPSVFLSKESGPGGATVKVSGEGFAPGEKVDIRFHTERVGSTTADGAGKFSNVAITIPTSFSKFAPQQFDVTASGRSSLKTGSAPFEISG